MAKTTTKNYSLNSNETSYSLNEKSTWFDAEQSPLNESGWVQIGSEEEFNNYLEEYE